MAENTHISWAHHTFNPWWGCRKVSPACRLCYAARDSKRWGFDAWGSKGERRMLSDENWANPHRWNRAAERSGEQVRVFCASMADVFEDHPDLTEPRERLWRLIEATPALTWMLLTKRPENAAGMVPWGDSWPRHVWLGVSAETQRFADQRIPILLSLPAVVRFVSAAPLLGPVDLSGWLPVPTGAFCDQHWSWLCGRGQGACQSERLTWVITEGESGPKARPSHPDWFRSVRDQCATAGVAYHHKQNGEWCTRQPTDWPVGDVWINPKRHCWVDPVTGKTKPFGAFTGTDDLAWAHVSRVGVKAAGRELDGREHLEFPMAVTSNV